MPVGFGRRHDHIEKIQKNFSSLTTTKSEGEIEKYGERAREREGIAVVTMNSTCDVVYILYTF